MNALLGLLFVAGFIYGIVVDGTFWKIYGICLTIYTVFAAIHQDSKNNPKRKIVTISTWDCKYSFKRATML